VLLMLSASCSGLHTTRSCGTLNRGPTRLIDAVEKSGFQSKRWIALASSVRAWRPAEVLVDHPFAESTILNSSPEDTA
jgi:hypothetical protein